MLHKAHIVDVNIRVCGLGKHYRVIPEAEAVHPAAALGDSEEGFAVIAFHTGYDVEFAVQLNGAGIEYAVHSDSLCEIRVALFIEVVTPDQGACSAVSRGYL